MQNPQLMQQVLAGLGAGGAAGGAGGRGGGGAGGNRRMIQITPEEKAQLDQLEALGFSRQRALEAWLICERNYELAASYLVEHQGDDDMFDEEPRRGAGGGGAGGGQ